SPRQLFVREAQAAPERIGAEAEVDREVGADTAPGVRRARDAERKLVELADIAGLEFGEPAARVILRLDPQVGALVEHLLDRHPGLVEPLARAAQPVFG